MIEEIETSEGIKVEGIENIANIMDSSDYKSKSAVNVLVRDDHAADIFKADIELLNSTRDIKLKVIDTTTKTGPDDMRKECDDIFDPEVINIHRPIFLHIIKSEGQIEQLEKNLYRDTNIVSFDEIVLDERLKDTRKVLSKKLQGRQFHTIRMRDEKRRLYHEVSGTINEIFKCTYIEFPNKPEKAKKPRGPPMSPLERAIVQSKKGDVFVPVDDLKKVYTTRRQNGNGYIVNLKPLGEGCKFNLIIKADTIEGAEKSVFEFAKKNGYDWSSETHGLFFKDDKPEITSSILERLKICKFKKKFYGWDLELRKSVPVKGKIEYMCKYCDTSNPRFLMCAKEDFKYEESKHVQSDDCDQDVVMHSTCWDCKTGSFKETEFVHEFNCATCGISTTKCSILHMFESNLRCLECTKSSMEFFQIY